MKTNYLAEFNRLAYGSYLQEGVGEATTASLAESTIDEYLNEGHEKCAEGSHWNETKGKCMPLSSFKRLGRAMDLAKHLTAKAKVASKKAKSVPEGQHPVITKLNHETADRAHRDAAHAHFGAAAVAAHHGFTKLQNDHDRMRVAHDQMSRQHHQSHNGNAWTNMPSPHPEGALKARAETRKKAGEHYDAAQKKWGASKAWGNKDGKLDNYGMKRKSV